MAPWFYRALESVSIASALSTALYNLPMPDPSPSTLPSLKLQLLTARKEWWPATADSLPRRLPDNCETHCVSGNRTHNLPIVSPKRYQSVFGNFRWLWRSRARTRARTCKLVLEDTRARTRTTTLWSSYAEKEVLFVSLNIDEMTTELQDHRAAILRADRYERSSVVWLQRHQRVLTYLHS